MRVTKLLVQHGGISPTIDVILTSQITFRLGQQTDLIFIQIHELAIMTQKDEIHSILKIVKYSEN